jgi:hypothetical protein
LKSSIASSPISVFASRILGLWLLVLPFSVGLANVLMGLNLLLIPLLPKVREHIKTSDFLKHPLLSIYILTAISLLWSADVGFGIRELKTQLPLVMSALIISVWSAFDREVVIKGCTSSSMDACSLLASQLHSICYLSIWCCNGMSRCPAC